MGVFISRGAPYRLIILISSKHWHVYIAYEFYAYNVFDIIIYICVINIRVKSYVDLIYSIKL